MQTVESYGLLGVSHSPDSSATFTRAELRALKESSIRRRTELQKASERAALLANRPRRGPADPETRPAAPLRVRQARTTKAAGKRPLLGQFEVR